MVEGQLEDPFHEFFIAAEHKVSDEEMWHSKYRIDSTLLPSFINNSLAKKVCDASCVPDVVGSLVGVRSCRLVSPSTSSGTHVKTVNGFWIRAHLAGSMKVIHPCLSALHEWLSLGLSYGEIDALETMVNLVAQKTNKRVLDLLFTKYQLKEHCDAIKRYLLLGQGDFIQYLMDMLGPDLSKPANQLVNFRHNLTGVLESAIRASNAQFDNTELSQRLGVRIGQVGDSPPSEIYQSFCGYSICLVTMDGTSSRSNIELTCLSTSYYAKRSAGNTLGGLRLVNSSFGFGWQVMESYLQLFNFLWRLKRIEYSLTSTWRRQMTSGRLMNKVPLCACIYTI